MFWEKGRGGLAKQPVGPPVGTATMTAAMSVNRVALACFISQCVCVYVCVCVCVCIY